MPLIHQLNGLQNKFGLTVLSKNKTHRNMKTENLWLKISLTNVVTILISDNIDFNPKGYNYHKCLGTEAQRLPFH